MDKKIIQQYGEEILCYKLRTKRQKQRMQYEDFDKYLIALQRESEMLFRKKSSLGWEPLNPPIQRGWKRTFVLRDDVAASQYAVFYQRILDRINTSDWSYRKDFLVKKKKRGKKIHVLKTQYLLQPREYQFKKMNFSEEEQRQFYEEFRYDKWKRGLVKCYVFSEPWRFVLRTKPNIIDKTSVKDYVLETRLNEIGSFLEKNNLYPRQCKALSRSYGHRKWRGYPRYTQVDVLKNKSLSVILDIIKDES